MLSIEKTIIDIKNERQLKAVAGVTESQLKIKELSGFKKISTIT